MSVVNGNIDDIFENLRVSRLTKNLNRSPIQINQVHEGDAELIRISDSIILAVSSDSISEEIELGFYSHPYTMGWVLINAAFSDIAAAGAMPLGVTNVIQVPPSCESRFLEEIFHGMEDACKNLGTFILGGDMNSGATVVFSATAIGQLERKYATRKGTQVGDRLFITGKMGSGNYLVWKKLQGENWEDKYRPCARLNYNSLILKYASAAIDTSDGFISAVDQLMRINQTGFQIHAAREDFIISHGLIEPGLNPFLLLAAQHGEYELLFSVPPEKVNALKSDADKTGLPIIEIGEAISDQKITMDTFGDIPVDSQYLRNLFENSSGNLQTYLENLFRYGQTFV